jgi:hypothetical protein
MNAGNRAFVRRPTATFCLLEFRYQIIMVHEVAILPGDTRLLSKVSEAALRIGAVFPSRYLHPPCIKEPPKISSGTRGHTRRKPSVTA